MTVNRNLIRRGMGASAGAACFGALPARVLAATPTTRSCVAPTDSHRFCPGGDANYDWVATRADSFDRQGPH